MLLLRTLLLYLTINVGIYIFHHCRYPQRHTWYVEHVEAPSCPTNIDALSAR